MKQFKAYIGRNSGDITCINDAFGPSVAVFNIPYRPGEIATRKVAHEEENINDFQELESAFRIIREVSEVEVLKLAELAKCLDKPIRDGWWYEVIGD